MVVAVVGLVWLCWAALAQANPPVSAQVGTFHITSDTEASFTLTVQRPDPSVPVTCRVIAQSEDFQRVGQVDIAVPARTEKLVDVTQTMHTAWRATSVSLDSCHVD